ncbi:hypothetical protein VSU19_08685 [Verrucomicrobiales bacterium BCK34]|nr:hypothetical protein [Verrucomicrobiales bacterium BCK34]
MKVSGVLSALSLVFSVSGAIADDESTVIAHFEKAGARITKNPGGHAIKLMSGGRPPHSLAELQNLEALTHLEELALNDPVGGDNDWEFLRNLPHLRKLTIWHCKTIQSLKPFSGLKIESLTVGGSMGLRDLNKENPEAHLNAVLTLTDLPNLKSVNLYHTPLLPHDEHLAHLASEFPKLEEVKIDCTAPRGFEISITPAGLAELGKLPLKLLSIENVSFFTGEHVRAIAGIKTLEVLLIDSRRVPFDTTELETVLAKSRPDIEIQIAREGAKGPPTRSRK